ncbi:hypothetical protein HKK52_28880 [Pseudomonas sp. ADAK2]|uniref:hypothetical protein n=1 Tax=unclassified Pseudomonas TaxID=196821 RepID=UPI0014647D45|nr:MULTISPECIES: hypothetical protein [unclassified Pseudomonas]QJI44804.1 hypothetical protein HKK53_28880 [Pseudomonas sp. ADAK7]QJI51105.1 hypothetical protein HKK52_28880 [Pseudomonas sp. ADAK2]
MNQPTRFFRKTARSGFTTASQPNAASYLGSCYTLNAGFASGYTLCAGIALAADLFVANMKLLSSNSATCDRMSRI